MRELAIVGIAGLIATACATSAPAMPPATAEAAAATPLYRNIEFGEPIDDDNSDDLILDKGTHVISYNCGEGRPNWVSWHLAGSHFGPVDRSSWRIDRTLPPGCPRVSSADYTNTGFTRGHVVRHKERSLTEEENQLTFLMTNVIPQYQSMNDIPWGDLEDHLCYLTRDEGREAFIVAGPHGDMGRIGSHDEVVVPTHAWKVALVMPTGRSLSDVEETSDVEVIAVLIPNGEQMAGDDWQDYLTSIDELEALTGYDFFTLFAEPLEGGIESIVPERRDAPKCSW